jgi:hypothetical protein
MFISKSRQKSRRESERVGTVSTQLGDECECFVKLLMDVIATGSIDESLTAAFEAESAAYDRRFARKFKLPSEYSGKDYTRFAQDMTSSMIGGIGYFEGESIVDRSFKQAHDDDYDDDDDDDGEDEEEDIVDDERKKATKGPQIVGSLVRLVGVSSLEDFTGMKDFIWPSSLIGITISREYRSVVEEDYPGRTATANVSPPHSRPHLVTASRYLRAGSIL